MKIAVAGTGYTGYHGCIISTTKYSGDSFKKNRRRFTLESKINKKVEARHALLRRGASDGT